jgi:hypothetical protein
MRGKKPRRTKKDKRREDLLDEALDQTFPASDPPAIIMPHPEDEPD